ncbi:MAG: SOS response-associated peptidase [Bacteroidetes bacterium]|nr:SOS response-associated peptidase [Bacteroidota bacterium]
MCFNMSIVKEIEAIQDEFKADFAQHPILTEKALTMYNLSGFAHPEWPVICKESPKVIHMLNWGLIPHWIRDSAAAGDIRNKTLNARGETLGKLPSDRYSFPKKTCLIITEGFFEPHQHQKTSYPFYLHRSDNHLLSLGGIYADWTDPGSGKIHRSFSIITVPSTGLIDQIHNHKHRMPLIIPEKERAQWLDSGQSVNICRQMIQSREPDLLTAYPVSRALYAKGIDTNTQKIRERFNYAIHEIDSLAG